FNARRPRNIVTSEGVPRLFHSPRSAEPDSRTTPKKSVMWREGHMSLTRRTFLALGSSAGVALDVSRSLDAQSLPPPLTTSEDLSGRNVVVRKSSNSYQILLALNKPGIGEAHMRADSRGTREFRGGCAAGCGPYTAWTKYRPADGVCLDYRPHPDERRKGLRGGSQD